jgi:tetratricopeptide (TPR) repeat protein
MQSNKNWLKLLLILTIIWTLLFGSFYSHTQDFVVSSDIGGSSSVFAFPKSRKAPKRYVAGNQQKVRRTQVQRVATRTRIRKQYDNLAKVTTRRDKIEIIKPQDLIPRADPVKASLALTGAAQYYFNENEIDKSVEYFREANKLNPKNDLARLGLSDALTRKGDDFMALEESKIALAEKFYNEAITFNAENSAAYSGLGEVYDESGDSAKAIASYEKALQIDPDLTDVSAPLGILYYQTGDIAKADTYLKKALATEPNDSQTQYFLGLVRSSQNQDKDAETAFRKSIALEPAFAEAHYYLGTTLAKLDLEAEAIDEYKEAIKLNPKYVEAQFDLGAAYYNTGKYQESVDAYLQALKLKNDNVEAYFNLADAYRQLADNDNTIKGKYAFLAQAMSRYSMGFTFIQNNPKLGEAFSNDELADVYSRYGYTAGEHNMLSSAQGITHNWNKSIDALTKAAELKRDALDYANLGWAYYNAARIDLRANPDAAKEKLSQAKANLEKAKSLNPNQEILTAIRLNMGITSIDLGDFKAAIENLKPVAEARSDWAFANYSLGVAYFKSGDLNNALDQFKKAVDKQGNYVAALSGLGNAYLQKNDQKGVKNVIEQLKKLRTAEAVQEANRLQFALSLKK